MNLPSAIYFLILFFTALYGFLTFKNHRPAYRMLIILSAISFVTEVIGEFTGKSGHNNMPLFHIYTVVEYLFLTATYHKLLSGRIKKIIVTIVPFALIFAIVNSFFLQGFSEFPSNLILLCEILYLFYSLSGFRNMLLKPSNLPLYKQSFFWLNLALMFFSTALFMYFGLLNYLNHHHFAQHGLVLFVNITNMIYAALLSIAIFKDKINAELDQNETRRQ